MTAKPSKQLHREALAKHTEEFQQRGGIVQKIPVGQVTPFQSITAREAEKRAQGKGVA